MASNTFLLTKLNCALFTYGWCFCYNFMSVCDFFQTTQKFLLRWLLHVQTDIPSSGLPYDHNKKLL